MIQVLLFLFLLNSPGFGAGARIQAGETIYLRARTMSSETDVSSFFKTDDAGSIDLPRIGKIQVARLTAAEATRVIDEAGISRGVFGRPVCTVFLGDPDFFLTVDGEVKRPGRITVVPNQTLLQSIDEAGGFTEAANQKKVRLMRGNQVKICNVAAIIRQPEQDLLVAPGDKVRADATLQPVQP